MGPPAVIGNNIPPGPSVMNEDISTMGPWSAGPYHTGYYAWKREWVIGIEDNQTTHKHLVPQLTGLSVLVHKEESHEDQVTFPVQCTNHVVIHAASKQLDIVDLYSAGRGEDQQGCQPFLQHILFAGPQREIIQVKALFDEGAMQHRGEVDIAGVQTKGEFEVFESGGGWKFLLRKLMLQAFEAIHEYQTDTVNIAGNGASATIQNQNKDTPKKAKATQDMISHQ
ncbi:hypothetical protein BDR07DRAFT_1383371 [Suillus spraguei]|nr:hypothetical protein BDR07DRAFT_1383371 [Suillus spraguei]